MQELANRFKEPSSWAGVAVVIDVLAPMVGIPPGVGSVLVTAAASLAGVLAFFLKEKK